jgi:hypothetical protein
MPAPERAAIDNRKTRVDKALKQGLISGITSPKTY